MTLYTNTKRNALIEIVCYHVYTRKRVETCTLIRYKMKTPTRN